MYCIISSGNHCQIDCYRLLITGIYYYIQFLASLRKSHFCIYFLIKEKDVRIKYFLLFTKVNNAIVNYHVDLVPLSSSKLIPFEICSF
ncbi:hypothetical protein P5673_023718 [Acropora cervicornis]|uniref:Uncharacterized protein n=1 Tax=Acropora cervicornis TaxID=6130 RepID=A0AAD9Q562_ACRCE|nr:hypothetical protein P5673_023718 [Acropora cervicornis]